MIMECPQPPTTLIPVNQLPCNPAASSTSANNCYTYLQTASQTSINNVGENIMYHDLPTDTLVQFCRENNTKCSSFLDYSCKYCTRAQVSGPSPLGALCGCYIVTDSCDTVCNRGAFTVKQPNQVQCNFGGACIIDNITIGTAAVFPANGNGSVEQSCNCATCECIIDRSIVDTVGYVQKCASNKCFIREIDGSMTIVPCGSSGEGWSTRTKSMFIAGVIVVGLALALAFMNLIGDDETI